MRQDLALSLPGKAHLTVQWGLLFLVCVQLTRVARILRVDRHVYWVKSIMYGAHLFVHAVLFCAACMACIALHATCKLGCLRVAWGSHKLAKPNRSHESAQSFGGLVIPGPVAAS